MPKPGRNAPCPCGSGLKHKRCCGRGSGTTLRGFTSADRESAMRKLLWFLEGPDWPGVVEDAEDEFWDHVDGPEPPPGETDPILAMMSRCVFEAWLFYDYDVEPNRTAVDVFLATAPGLSPQERRYLRTMRTTVLRLYEVTDVRPGESITLRDVFTNAVVRVRERGGSQGLPCWTWVAARVTPQGASGQPEIDGGMLPIPMARHESLVEELREELDELRELRPEADERALWGALAPIMHAAWRSPVPLPRMVNYDGDPLVLTTVRFAAVDPEQLAGALDRHRSLDREPESLRWTWTGKGRNRKEPAVLGWFTLHDGRLELETNSVERAARGRKLVARLGGQLVRHEATVTADAVAALQRAREQGPPPPSPELDPELRNPLQDAAEDFLAEYYERWLDEEIPMLDGRTPRQAAVGSSDLRARLVGLIKDLEHMYEAALAQGDAAYDSTWIREELELGEALDADRGPRPAPQPAHASVVAPMPAIVLAARAIAERLRRERALDLQATVSPVDLDADLVARAFVRDHVEPLTDASEREERHAWLLALCNFELQLRKSFWVAEPLAWMLGATALDITGEALRLPFASFAIVFTDRYALGLAERMLSRHAGARLRGRMLRSVTAYVTQTSDGDERHVEVALACDADDGRLPSLLVRELVIRPDATLDAILDSHVPGPSSALEPVFAGSPVRNLVHLVLNAILYASSMRPSGEPSSIESPAPPPQRVVVPSDSVYYLPGTIDIRSLAQLKQLRRSGGKRRSIMSRSLVRGHWRHAPEQWTDPRPRWIAPHWRGPAEAAIIEKSYRLEP